MAHVVGTRCKVISSTYIPLAQMPPIWKYNIIVAAGCTANFAVALISFGLLRRGAITRTAVRFFLWLLMCVNLFLASTYIARSEERRVGEEGRSRWSPY